MCPPAVIAALTIATSIASTGIGYMGQQQQYAAQQQAYEQNVKNARTSTYDAYDATQLRIEQEGAAANQQKFEANLQTRQAVATARVAAGEGNVSGLSVDAVLGDFYAQGGRNNSAIDQNLDMTRGALMANMKEQQARGQNQINSMPKPIAPSILPSLISVFGQGIGSYTQYKDWTR